ncbi:MAG: type II toxin-antitoxin system prevent-host-death family antitoxin, partial [Proteobacteria bacterium]|nr:type II toxin-antitoxin system prevent-host-death family antitoxin [Pseudomonadota bacterium]
MLNVSVSEAQSNLAEILDRVHRDKQRIALGNEGEPLAVLVPIDDLGLLAGHGGPALQDGEQRFRDFAETASDWFWETDEHLRFSYFSGRHDDIGLEIKKTLGKTRPEVTIEDTAQKKWRAHLADLAVQKPFKDFRYAGRARDGRVIQLSVSGRPIFDEAGNFKGYRGTGTDITALTKAENALTAAKERAVAAEAQLDEALEAMSEGFAYFDAEDRLIRCNSKHRELFPSHAEAMVPGARFEDLLRKQVQNIHLPWAAGREEEWIAERVAQHRTPGEPVEQRFANGRVIRLSE